MEKISIVIPVYNVESWLPRCLNSVIEQTYKNIEILLIDDHSCDDSFNICKLYANNDNRIITYQNNGKGVGSARNLGISKSTGEYICFIDSDDYVDINMCSKLYSLIKKLKDGINISCCGFDFVYKDSNKSFYNKNNQISILNSFEALSGLLNGTNDYGTVWAKLYDKRIFINNRFVEDMIFEDGEIIHRLLGSADSIIYTTENLYFYNCLNKQSIVNSKFSIKNYDRAIADYNRFLYCKKNYSSLSKMALESYLRTAFNLIYISTKNNKCKEERKKLIKQMKIVFEEEHDIIDSIAKPIKNELYCLLTCGHLIFCVYYILNILKDMVCKRLTN